MDFFLADSHLRHTNIVTYCGRPFKDVDHMDETIISNWNAVVRPEDTVYHLGDFALAPTDVIKELPKRLNGRKILIMGNHDRSKTVTFWRKIGITAYKMPMIYHDGTLTSDILTPDGDGEFILSHEPVAYPTIPNVHGHTHGNLHRGEISEHGIHVCVSCEEINYTPVSIEYIREQIRRRYGRTEETVW